MYVLDVDFHGLTQNADAQSHARIVGLCGYLPVFVQYGFTVIIVYFPFLFRGIQVYSDLIFGIGSHADGSRRIDDVPEVFAYIDIDSQHRQYSRQHFNGNGYHQSVVVTQQYLCDTLYLFGFGGVVQSHCRRPSRILLYKPCLGIFRSRGRTVLGTSVDQEVDDVRDFRSRYFAHAYRAEIGIQIGIVIIERHQMLAVFLGKLRCVRGNHDLQL